MRKKIEFIIIIIIIINYFVIAKKMNSLKLIMIIIIEQVFRSVLHSVPRYRYSRGKLPYVLITYD